MSVGKRAPREADERLLQWLSWADAGYSYAAIAADAGVSPRYIKSALYKVRRADKEAHGEHIRGHA